MREIDNLARDMLDAGKTELYLAMRYLYPALDAMQAEEDLRINWIGTDGKKLIYLPILLRERYKENPVLLNRAILHSLLHLLFSHLHLQKDHEPARWQLAADITCECLIDGIELPVTMIMIPEEKERFEKELLEQLQIISVQGVYQYLGRLPDTRIARLEELFHVDDHSFWPQENPEEPSGERRRREQEEQKLWEEIREKVQSDAETYGRTIGIEKTRLFQAVFFENGRRHSYRTFLRRFARPREQMRLDLDAFDYGYYTYGLTLYGNMPLIEEPEYKEQMKIRSFAIAFDTSGSCSKEQILQFLQQTMDFFLPGEDGRTEYFAKNTTCILIQCDNQIQDIRVIRNPEELQAYLQAFRIAGRGGTDFRPVFDLLRQMQATGQIAKLEGLIYFTDGYGIYPQEKPAYPTAFAFPEGTEAAGNAPWRSGIFPSWAIHTEIGESNI